MASQEQLFNDLAEGIALGTTEVCDILKHDPCDLSDASKKALLDKLADEKAEDARIPAQERRKTLVDFATLTSTTGSDATFSFDNTGKNLVSISVASVLLGDLAAVSPSLTIGGNVYSFTEEGETVSISAPDGGYLFGDLTIVTPATTVAGTNVTKVVLNYEEI